MMSSTIPLLLIFFGGFWAVLCYGTSLHVRERDQKIDYGVQTIVGLLTAILGVLLYLALGAHA
jgi:hypothetical protein